MAAAKNMGPRRITLNAADFQFHSRNNFCGLRRRSSSRPERERGGAVPWLAEVLEWGSNAESIALFDEYKMNMG